MIFSNDALKTIFNSCQDLESIITWDAYGCRRELLKTVAKYSPKNFHELKLMYFQLFPDVLESFLIEWKNRTSKKSLSLITNMSLEEESEKIIEKYKNLGIIKNFEVRGLDDEVYI